MMPAICSMVWASPLPAADEARAAVRLGPKHVAQALELAALTHPDFQGKGLARQLVTRLIRREMQRNETPFLHVLHHNTGARRLYERMGFRDHLVCVARVVAPC